MSDTAEKAPEFVEFRNVQGVPVYARYEIFPLKGGPPVPTLVIQPQNGHAAGETIRVDADTEEATALLQLYPELTKLEKPARPANAPVTTQVSQGIDYDKLAAAIAKHQAQVEQKAEGV